MVVLKDIEEVEAGLAWLATGKSTSGSLRASAAAFAGGSGVSGLLCLGLSGLLCGLSGALVGANGSLLLLVLLCLLGEDGQLHEVIKLSLGALDVGIVDLLTRTHLLDDLVSLLLEL